MPSDRWVASEECRENNNNNLWEMNMTIIKEEERSYIISSRHGFLSWWVECQITITSSKTNEQRWILSNDEQKVQVTTAIIDKIILVHFLLSEKDNNRDHLFNRINHCASTNGMSSARRSCFLLLWVKRCGATGAEQVDTCYSLERWFSRSDEGEEGRERRQLFWWMSWKIAQLPLTSKASIWFQSLSEPPATAANGFSFTNSNPSPAIPPFAFQTKENNSSLPLTFAQSSPAALANLAFSSSGSASNRPAPNHVAPPVSTSVIHKPTPAPAPAPSIGTSLWRNISRSNTILFI